MTHDRLRGEPCLPNACSSSSTSEKVDFIQVEKKCFEWLWDIDSIKDCTRRVGSSQKNSRFFSKVRTTFFPSVMSRLTAPLAERMVDCKTKADKEQFKYDICEYICPATELDPHSKAPDYLWRRKSDFKPQRKHLIHEICRRESGHRPAQWPVSKMMKFLLETPGGREIEMPTPDAAQAPEAPEAADEEDIETMPAPASTVEVRRPPVLPATRRPEATHVSGAARTSKSPLQSVKFPAGDLQRLCEEEKLRRLKRENDLAQEEETNRLIEHYEVALEGIENATNATVKAMRSKQAASLKRKIDRLLEEDAEHSAIGENVVGDDTVSAL